MKIDTTALADALAANTSGVKKNGDSSGSDFSALLRQAETKQSDAAAELQKYLELTPAQRIAQAMMKRLGITQAQFDAMSPAEQAAVTAKITQMIKQDMDEKMAQNQGATSSGAI